MKQSSKTKKGKWLLEYIVLQLLTKTLSCLSHRRRTKLLARICLFIGKASSKARKRIEENLLYAFPDKDDAWRKKRMEENLIAMAYVCSNYIARFYMSKKQFHESCISKPSAEAFRQSLYEKDEKPCLMITGHIGDIEALGCHLAQFAGQGGGLRALAKKQRNPWVNQWLYKVRSRWNVLPIYIDDRRAISNSLRSFQKGHLFALAADQDAGKQAPYYPFLGRLASTYRGPAFIARISKMPVLFIWSYYQEGAKLVVEYEKVAEPKVDINDVDEWERHFTYAWVKLLERKIREHPHAYFWLHKRWRHQPENPEELWAFWNAWEKKHAYPLSLPSQIAPKK